MESAEFTGAGFPLAAMKCFWTRWKWLLHTIVNVLATTELKTLKSLILHHVNFTLIKKEIMTRKNNHNNKENEKIHSEILIRFHSPSYWILDVPLCIFILVALRIAMCILNFSKFTYNSYCIALLMRFYYKTVNLIFHLDTFGFFVILYCHLYYKSHNTILLFLL